MDMSSSLVTVDEPAVMELSWTMTFSSSEVATDRYASMPLPTTLKTKASITLDEQEVIPLFSVVSIATKYLLSL